MIQLKSRKVLLLGPDSSLIRSLAAELRTWGFDVRNARAEGQLLSFPPENYAAIVADLECASLDQRGHVWRLKQHYPDAEIVLISGGPGREPFAVAAKAEALDYVAKPVIPSQLAALLRRISDHRRPAGQSAGDLGGIIFASAAVERALEFVRKVAPTDSTVLIQGESGTGKELIAKAVHRCSPRRTGPFIPVNCGALPEGLLESELFGHVRGSFTGAQYNTKGLFEEASGGTLFLDEISETTPAFQVKLLRALEEGEIRKVGDIHPIKVSGRIVAAANKDLCRLVEQGKFRQDLFYRLNVFPIVIPPLRERRDDIAPLAEHFLKRAAKKLGRAGLSFSPEASESLRRHDWPGNVRELENTVERAAILASSEEVIERRHLPEDVLRSRGGYSRIISATTGR